MKKQLLGIVFVSLTFLSYSQAPAFQWAGQAGGSDYDSGNALAVDASGNVYTAGYFASVTDFDQGPATATLSCAGSYDAYLSKFDASGNFVWVRHVAASDAGSTSYALGVKTDAGGNVYVAGVFNGTNDFDPGVATNTVTANGNDDTFISKFDASGNLYWVNTFGGTGSDALNGICLDASGNVYVTGAFSSTVDFDPSVATYTLSAAGADIFILKLTAAGSFVWAKQMVGTGYNTGSAITDGPSGKIYVTGNFQGTVDFDPGATTYSLAAVGIYDSYILQLDASGNFGWAKQIGGAGEYSYGYGLATDASGNIYNTGTFSGTVDMDPGAGTQNATSAGINDVFINKLTSTGVFLWAKQIGGAGDDYAFGIATDAGNAPYITGTFQDTVDFNPSVGTYTLSAGGDNDMFITKFDGSGNMLWATAYGGGFSEVYGYGICVDAVANVYATGSFNFIEDFDPATTTYTLNSVGYTDAFTLKLGQCTAPPAPVITSTATSALTICSGNNVSLTASGTGTLSWYASSTATTAIATGTVYTTPSFTTGTYTYYAGATTCTSSATRASVTVTVNTCTGLESLNGLSPEISLYPNPTNGKLYLKLSTYQNTTVRVYDLLGNMVMEQAIDREQTTLNLNGQVSGIYLVMIINGQEVLATKRIVKE
jgi:hypothetical protein